LAGLVIFIEKGIHSKQAESLLVSSEKQQRKKFQARGEEEKNKQTIDGVV
jgi:hypothetical protein